MTYVDLWAIQVTDQLRAIESDIAVFAKFSGSELVRVSALHQGVDVERFGIAWTWPNVVSAVPAVPTGQIFKQRHAPCGGFLRSDGASRDGVWREPLGTALWNVMEYLMQIGGRLRDLPSHYEIGALLDESFELYRAADMAKGQVKRVEVYFSQGSAKAFGKETRVRDMIRRRSPLQFTEANVPRWSFVCPVPPLHA